MLFPVSGVEVHPVIPFVVAFGVSFFTSMGGVSGAFLLLPFQVSVLGYTMPSVSATNHVFNIVAIPGGVYRYIREGRMLWPLAWLVIIGTLPGVFIGAWVRVVYLPDPDNFKLFAGIILLYIGWRLVMDAVKKREKQDGIPIKSINPSSSVMVETTSLKQIRFSYQGKCYQFSPVGVCAICMLVGVAGGIYGIGGGAIVAPFFVAIIGLPVYVVSGAALLGTFITSVGGVIFYHYLSKFYPGISIAPDWRLGLLFGAGGVLGIYLGARTQKHFPAATIKWILTFCILFVAGKYILGYFL